MKRPRLALLDASNEASTRRNFRRELDAELIEFDVDQHDLPDSFNFDGVVVTGSRSSVYWNDSWSDALIDWVSEAADHGLPTLGVCYGHQILAEALGGHVDSMGEYELGYRTVEHLGNDELFADIAEEFTAFTSHSDTVAELPPGAKLIAENDYGVHAFRKGHCWGVQFHPEYDRQTAREIASSKDLPSERLRSVLDGITADNYDAAQEATQLFDNFVAHVRRVSDSASTAEATV